MIFKITLTALLALLQVLRATWAQSTASHMIKGGFKISTVSSLQFAVVNRDNVRDVVSVHRVVWAINDLKLYRGLNVINPYNISSLQLLIYRVIKKSLWTWWLQYIKLQVIFKVSPPVSRHLLTHRNVFSKTVFSIARSIFWMFSVTAIVNSSIVWGLFEYPEFYCKGQVTETFWSPCI